jgi:hypothetical protein
MLGKLYRNIIRVLIFVHNLHEEETRIKASSLLFCLPADFS